MRATVESDICKEIDITNLEKVPRSAEFAHAVAPDRVRPSKCEGVIAWQISYTSCVAAVGDKNGRRWFAGTILLLV
jgi:hypothetical protein